MSKKQENLPKEDGASRPVQHSVMCKLYLGNYGFPLNECPDCEAPELPEWAFKFVDKELKNNISRMNRISWLKERLRILADILEDRKQGYFANELRCLIDRVGT